ncbi:MAG: Smr/MutS family protein [Chloroflexi bacterium]|nr:Smr/MutS family protein [Chloroflexota bacterium]
MKTGEQKVAAVEEAELKPITAVTAPPKPSTKQIRRKLQVGDTVLVKSLDRKGEVVSLSNNEALVAMGRLQMRARFEDLEFKGRPVEEELEIAGYSTAVSAASGFELDLRGKRVEEGLAELERFLDTAFLSRMPWVRIIHGKGTGRMRDGVRVAPQQQQPRRLLGRRQRWRRRRRCHRRQTYRPQLTNQQQTNQNRRSF